MKRINCLFVATLALTAFLFLVSSARAYTDTANGFSITPPAGWTTKEGVEGVVVAFLGPQDPDVGPVNINVDVKETFQTLETIIENTKQSWSTTYSDYSLITDKNLVINGNNGHELEILHTENGTPFMQDSVIFLENGNMYQVTYLAGPTTYDTYAENWQQSLDTFQIMSAQSTSDSSNGFNFYFETKGLPFLLLVVAVVAIVIVVVVVLVRKSKNSSSKVYLPPPPPPAQ